MRRTIVLKPLVTGVCAVALAIGVAITPVSLASAVEDSGVSVGSTEAPAAPGLTPTPAPTPTDEPTESPVDDIPATDAPATDAPATDAPAIVPAPAQTPVPTPAPAPLDEAVDPLPDATPPASGDALTLRDREVAALAGFNPGNIISDYNFYNSWAMTESEIQNFLDARCTGASCLNDLRFDTPTRTWSWGTCGTYNGAANESAARIIYKVQRACGISAKVILVTLQKEQGLVTRTSPSDSILRKAMGYGCPDTDVCDSTYYGFFNQLFAAGRQLTWYTNPEGSFTQRFKVGATVPVQFHRNGGCGTSPVFISNKATAALYYYTPYQPNAAALAAGYDAANNACSSYGNRNFFNYYSDWFGDPTAGGSPAATRLAGADRFDTAVAISKGSYPSSGVPVVYVTTGAEFPDALSAAPAAAAQGGPLLLTQAGDLPAAVKAEIARLKPKKIVVVGGEAAVSTVVQAELETIAPVTRVFGEDRYATSRAIAAQAFPTATKAYIATGANFPDALSAGAAAGVAKIPVLLVNGAESTLDAPTGAALAATSTVMISGGPVAVSAGIQTALLSSGKSVTRFAGTDRNQTSVLINRASFSTAKTAYLATGWSFPDALAGAAAAAKAKSPLFIVPTNCVPADTRSTLVSTLKVTTVTMLGGPGALFDRVAALAGC
ncbi:cell wall-binding repeat-containing protein [Glaciibacter psychrotolerans]|uniref:Putative cell wall-binding protein n=1 Tax=Glaciibacter psychrotolerans TaxID=670054 RepID=A0A7Z0EFF5_9MICO|nr:cell wall-binding repeat-containing protein [Leifsonia psychrotolerans]NYJ20260.1 putative cell wall-binding protein [Leifsonia psychrotolerans]